MSTLLELQDLYSESLVKEIIEKTKRGGLTWTHLGGTQFQATYTLDNPSPTPDNVWDYYVTKTQIGNVSYRYTLDIKKDGVAYITVQDGALTNTDRSSGVDTLFEIVEVIVFQLDDKIKETLQILQNVPTCLS